MLRLPIGLGAAFLLLAGCLTRRDPVDEIARNYVRLAVALGERDPDSLDFYSGPANGVADIRANPPSLREIRKSAASLLNRVESLHPQGDTSRVKFLSGQLRAISARAEQLTGVHRSFDDEAQLLFGIHAPPQRDSPEFAAIRGELARLLPGSGSLGRRYAAFERKFLIPSDRLPRVLERAIAGCRARTVSYLTLPPGESISVEYISNEPWDGYSSYQGHFHSLIRINSDYDLTVDRSLSLACHEAYPGHHVYNSLQDLELVQRRGRLELTVQPAFSPQSFASEAAATVAPDVAFPQSERLSFEREALFPIAGIDPSLAEQYLRVERLVAKLEMAEVPIARSYLDGELEFERAASALDDQLVMTDSEAMLKYLNEYRSYMLSYTLGKKILLGCLEGLTEQERWQRYRGWMTAGSALSSFCASE